MLDLIQNYGLRNGTLPNTDDKIADKFWRIYENPLTPESLWGTKGSVVWNAAKAGYTRRKVEPGIDPQKDFRIILGHSLNVLIQFEMVRNEIEYVGDVFEMNFNSLEQIENFVEDEIQKQETDSSYVEVVNIFALGDYTDDEGISMKQKHIGSYEPNGEWEWNLKDVK